jgi:hypothetical protein
MRTTPTVGTRRFRRCSLGVEDGALVVTDRHRTTRKFPLNEGKRSPTESLSVLPEPMGAFRAQFAVLDGNGNALVVGNGGEWDWVEYQEVLIAAGLTRRGEFRSEPVRHVREDGLILEDGTWFRFVPAAGTLTLIFSLLTGSGVLPAALGWVIVLALAGYVATAFASGAFGKGRRGKGADQEEAFMATGDSSVFDDDVAAPPSDPDTAPPATSSSDSRAGGGHANEGPSA